MATQAQAKAIQFAAGNFTLPGVQDNDYRSAQDGGWIVQVPSIVTTTEQQGTYNYIYFLMRGYTASTITTSQASSYAVARTIFDTGVSQRKLRTQWQSGQTYRNATKFLDSTQYPPNDGVGSYQFALYVATTNAQGIFMSQYPQCHKCTFGNYQQYPITSGGNMTLSFSSVIPTFTDAQQGAVVRNLPSSTGYYNRQVTGQASNQQHIVFLSTTNTAQTSDLVNYAARSYGTSTTRALGRTDVGSSTQIIDIPYGAGDAYYIYSRVFSGQNTAANGVYGQGSGSRIWDRVYYRSPSYYNGWLVYGTDDQVTLNPTSFQISEAQSQSSSTQLQTTVSGTTGQHTFRFSLNTSGAIGSAAGITAVSGTSAQINLSNGNSLFPGAGQSDQFYLWVKNGADSSGQYMPTNTLRSVTVSTQAAEDTTPDAPVLSPESYSGASTSTYYTSSWTTQGVSSGVQVPWQATGQGSPQLSANGTSGWGTSLQRTQGQTGYIRVSSDSQASTTVTGSVVFAQQTSIKDDLAVTTTSGGGSSGGGSGNYGIAIYNSTGQSVIIDQSSRIGSLLNNTTLQFSSGQSGSSSSGQHAFSGVNCQDDNKIAVVYRSDIFSQFQPVCEITRRTANQQYGITVKVPFSIPAQQSPQSVDLWLLRF